MRILPEVFTELSSAYVGLLTHPWKQREEPDESWGRVHYTEFTPLSAGRWLQTHFPKGLVSQLTDRGLFLRRRKDEVKGEVRCYVSKIEMLLLCIYSPSFFVHCPSSSLPCWEENQDQCSRNTRKSNSQYSVCCPPKLSQNSHIRQ